MTEFKKLLLARVHEVTQMSVDCVAWFLINQEGAQLQPADKQRLCEAYGDVTTALGRHTMAALSVNDMDLEKHLSELFSRIEALDAVSESLGGPKLRHIVTAYQKKLLEEEAKQ